MGLFLPFCPFSCVMHHFSPGVGGGWGGEMHSRLSELADQIADRGPRCQIALCQFYRTVRAAYDPTVKRWGSESVRPETAPSSAALTRCICWPAGQFWQMANALIFYITLFFENSTISLRFFYLATCEGRKIKSARLNTTISYVNYGNFEKNSIIRK